MYLSIHQQHLLLQSHPEAELRQKIKYNLSQVPQNSAWGAAIVDFLEHIESKTAKDISELLGEITEDIQDGPGTMKTVLGRSYQFFRRIKP